MRLILAAVGPVNVGSACAVLHHMPAVPGPHPLARRTRRCKAQHPYLPLLPPPCRNTCAAASRWASLFLAGLLLRELGREAADVLASHASQVAPPAFMAQVGPWAGPRLGLPKACWPPASKPARQPLGTLAPPVFTASVWHCHASPCRPLPPASAGSGLSRWPACVREAGRSQQERPLPAVTTPALAPPPH